MKSISFLQMEQLSSGKLTSDGWLCAIGTGVSGAIWSNVLGLAVPVAGLIVGLGWGLLSTWACDQVNDAAQQEQ